MGDRARGALGRHAWNEAYELLSEADTAGALAPDELELLAEASWWVGKLPDAIEARERAYAGHVKAGDALRAAFVAAALGQDNLLRGTYPVAAAWLNRAERHLRGVNLAARVEAAATAGEVLVSGETLAAARRQFRDAARRSVELKGFAEPVGVVAIDWR
jgi:class 3 adenylate cyclase